eukprot:sb/3464493/
MRRAQGMPNVCLVWDCFLYEGNITLFRIALGILSINKDAVIAQDSSESIFTELSNAPLNIEDVEQLIAQSYGISASLSDELLQEMRTEAAARLNTAANTPGNTPYNPRPVEQSRKLVDNKSTWFSQWFGYNGSMNDKAKNIAQTEMLEDLRSNIAAIVKHFGGDTRLDVSPDYSFESHQRDMDSFKEFTRNRPLRARALMDFERHDDDELGFCKNDIIKVLNQNDELCWFGEVAGVRGFFPAKFVLLLDERSKMYAIEGDDRVSNEITTLVRGNLCTSLRKIFEHGLRKPTVLGSSLHPWHFVEDSIDREIQEQFTQILGRLVLCKTFRLDEEEKVLQPSEMLFRAMHLINASHDPLNTSADVKLRSLICAGLNEQCLHMWFATFCQCSEVTERWYAPWSFIRSPAWFQIKCELRLLSKYAFNLSLDYEVTSSTAVQAQPIKNDVQDMLIKHHLFSWLS